jgi:hypothetical protein
MHIDYRVFGKILHSCVVIVYVALSAHVSWACVLEFRLLVLFKLSGFGYRSCTGAIFQGLVQTGFLGLDETQNSTKNSKNYQSPNFKTFVLVSTCILFTCNSINTPYASEMVFYLCSVNDDV